MAEKQVADTGIGAIGLSAANSVNPDPLRSHLVDSCGLKCSSADLAELQKKEDHELKYIDQLKEIAHVHAVRRYLVIAPLLGSFGMPGQ